ncbi:hypothetical protein BpOF4_04500 [Alkalihalophilus pseudofirmus OF4]|uniref:Uncharacterized protein n=1 Tax=Alkalihalophilus pseudofirmus (strain ATCC BAA-2126 / JCM 17055 / OF4) TaxID=398511 RepID=D3FYT1_ALKPO|nr:hypothetical protein BpOF4_04500 [Alkalihalophilus pseudofirmus OF4]
MNFSLTTIKDSFESDGRIKTERHSALVDHKNRIAIYTARDEVRLGAVDADNRLGWSILLAEGIRKPVGLTELYGRLQALSAYDYFRLYADRCSDYSFGLERLV